MSRREFCRGALRALGSGVLLGTVPSFSLAQSDPRSLSQASPQRISGRYPHLAMFNHGGECGIGAVAPWGNRLWAVTYSPHEPRGSDDGLYEITPDLEIVKREESIGGTPANRMIHRESDQLFIGPYAIDRERTVRPISYEEMPGRPTANARHLTQPADKIYYLTMEEGVYEVDVESLEVKMLYPDQNVTPGGIGGERLPGYHGKGAYTAQGRLVYSNNGRPDGKSLSDYRLPSGCLAAWEGRGEHWSVVAERQYTAVTGPGGLRGNASEDDPLWSVGWDYRSLELRLFDNGEWQTFRLPKGDFTYEGLHGWHTEWPRIRQVGPDGEYLMNMHGTWFHFPGNFSAASHPAPRPIGNYLKITGDFARWNDEIVFGCDDAAVNTFFEQEGLVGQSQSNLWFSSWEGLSDHGRPYGYGGPWTHDDVAAGTPSTPFSFAGMSNRQLHLSHESDHSIAFTVEVDREGTGDWQSLTTLEVPAHGYLHHRFPDTVEAEWIRLVPDRDGRYVSATLHYGRGGGARSDPEPFRALAPPEPDAPRSVGLVRARGGDRGTLEFAAWTVDERGRASEAGYYELDADLTLRRVQNREAHRSLKSEVMTEAPEYSVDDASVRIEGPGGISYCLPKGPAAFEAPTDFGWPRTRREVVTERDLFNVQGTLYYLPRPNSGGVAHMKPITTHDRRIVDFCSWRGLLVMTGCRTDLPDGAGGEHFIESEDGRVGLWVGDIDDLWQLGRPTGVGGPWNETEVEAGTPSDPYMMTGFGEKVLRLSHDARSPVTVAVEVNATMNANLKGDAYSRWHVFKQVSVPPNETETVSFPEGYSAHWARLTADQPCRATATFTYT
ncbi:MAG: hypothetical protein ABEL51_02485 [Salinibacter sp.]